MGAQQSTQLDGERLPPNFSWLIKGQIAAMGLPQRRDEMRGLANVNVQLFVTLNNAALIAGPRRRVKRSNLQERSLEHRPDMYNHVGLLDRVSLFRRHVSRARPSAARRLVRRRADVTT